MPVQKIAVMLTTAQIRALRRTATGELESLTEWDERSGIGDDLQSAVKALDDARRPGAKR